LLEHNIDLNFIPLVFQYNKRDLDNLIPVETFNNLLNPRRLPYIESSAIYGQGVIETLKEISKLAVPVVREKIFGKPREEVRPEEKEKKEAEKIEVVEPVPKKEVELVSKRERSPLRMTKIKFKSQKDIEEELEKLAKEFTANSKD